jgi:hypothetical protein
MTFSELNKRIKASVLTEQHPQQTKFFEQLKGKPFWYWNVERHRTADIASGGKCCFNHMIGLPEKNGRQLPLFDYERQVYHELRKSKYLWIKKATGLGISEFMLRYIAWLCLKDDGLKGSRMCIVTGPRIDLAITLIARIKNLFPTLPFDTKETAVELNGVKIEAYPSHHLDAMRGLTDVSFILLDEADFFPPGQQQDARDVSERYIGKSDPFIVLVSTPNAPEGLFEQIEKESDEKCLYRRLYLDYTFGINKIYTREEIEKARASPSFDREYDLKYIGKIGNVFHAKDIERAIAFGRQYNPDLINPKAPKSLGIDPAFGSSKFAFVLTQMRNGMIEVLYADEFDRPDFNEMVDKALSLMQRFGRTKVYVDAANPAIVAGLKRELGERTDYEEQIAYLKKHHSNPIYWMQVLPVSFNPNHTEMLGNTKMFLEKGLVAINPRFNKLITALRTAIEQDGVLDKASTSYNDTFDAFRLAMKYYEIT